MNHSRLSTGSGNAGLGATTSKLAPVASRRACLTTPCSSSCTSARLAGLAFFAGRRFLTVFRLLPFRFARARTILRDVYTIAIKKGGVTPMRSGKIDARQINALDKGD